MEVLNYIKNSLNLYLDFDDSYKEIDKEVSFWDSFLIYFGLSFIFFLALNIQDFWTTSSQSSIFYLVLKGSLMSLITSFCGLMFNYGIIYGMLQFFGGKADFKDTFKFALSAGVLPLIIGSILNLIVFGLYLDINYDEIAWSTFDIILMIVYSLVMFSTVVFSFIINMKSFEKLHDLKRNKVIISLFTPIIIGLVLLAGLIGTLFLIFK